MHWFTGGAAAADPGSGHPILDGPDATRPRIDVGVTLWLEGLSRPVDLHMPPGEPDVLVVVEQPGRLTWVNRRTRAGGVLAVPLPDLEAGGGEQGLLGLAFHPDFARNRRFYLNTTETARDTGTTVTLVTAWRAGPGPKWRQGPIVRERVLLSVPQPYSNHNGGGLVFGPDGWLYVGLGDGGSGGDPHGNGQNPDSPLGKMLRLDVDAPGEGPAPRTTFARGLRNPWRYSFDPRGRLVVGDVGQNRFEEIDLVPAGANLGWNIREGRHCFLPLTGCPEPSVTGPGGREILPVYEYGREEGVSVTGGVTYTGSAVPGLRGRYVFGDYGSGRLWALVLPEEAGTPATGVSALGRFGFSIACIARDPEGELLLCDHQGGRVWRVGAPLP